MQEGDCLGRMTMLYVRAIKGGFGHRFALARLTRWPLLGRAVDRALFDGDEIYVLPKGSSVTLREIPLDIPVPDREDVVLPSEIVRYFIERSKHHFIMDRCICRTSAHCRDYPHELGCIFLGKAVLAIDPRLGRLVSKEEALAHLDRCEEAGLVHIIGRNKLDSIWTAGRPKEDLMTVCNCCPCCCLWKMLPQLDEGISSKMKRLPGVHLTVDAARCTGCGTCVDGCYVRAISMREGRAVIDQAMCKGCARCAHACPEKAVTLHIEDGSYSMHAVERIAPLVDVTKD